MEETAEFDKEDFGQSFIGQPKEVEVKVKDSWDFTTPFMFVEWISDEGGYWEHPITMATFHTIGAPTAKNRWIPEKAGIHQVSAYVKNGQLKEVDRITLSTTTVEQ